jgi:sulfur relay (sulfurtransferase) complex TusBCD TusD component (DsrE family)
MAKTLTVLLMRGPFISEHADLAVNFALEAKKKGYNVNLWLYLDGVWVPHVKTEKDYSNVGEWLRWALQKGVNVKACERCANARDVVPEDIIDGIPIVAAYDLLNFLKESDKVVTFTG